MRPALPVFLTLIVLASRAHAECTPAAPEAIAEAERAARDAEHKADEAESVAVRSGNPGAARRAEQARRAAAESRARAEALRCAPGAAAGGAPEPVHGR
jgi:hypothetical protein